MTTIEKSPTGMLLDGVFASEAIDSSGESISIKGLDISTFDEGKGLANWEHKDSSGDSNGQEIVGKVVYARKIYNEDDCLDDRQKLFWKRTKLPFLYGVIRLYDGAGHDGAKAIAASIRDSVANSEPIVIGFSIEGATLQREGNKLKSTVARLVALTTKSCNKQAVSGILSDPNAPAGYDTNPEKARTVLKTVVDPMNMRLGGTETEYGADMLKALSAGSYNTAPGALTGGAALQVEDRTKKTAAMAKAAARDWPKTGKFRDFLKSYLEKAELGDVSDDFLDHFSDLVESKYYRVKKAEEVVASLKKAGKPVQWKPNVSEKTISSLKQKHGYETPEQRKLVDGIVRKIHHQKQGTAKTQVAAPLEVLTNNGVPVKPNKKLVEPKFDPSNGVLHMPQGSFKVYVPGQDPQHKEAFHAIMNDPKVEEFHGRAMENWVKAHQLLKAGKLPPEVAMHAVLFSILSPNTPVPMQENMYGHLVDSMKATGASPLTQNWPDVKQDWLERDQPQKFPDHSPEHWKRLEGALRLKHNSKLTGRVKGDIGAFMLANDKFDSMTKYAKMHAGLQDLLSRHRHNGRGAAEEMMWHKNEQTKWDNRRRLGLAMGKPDIGEYPGMSIAGLAPKTARYALAMMGAGNIHVPDTHFVRNLFGLNRQQDTATIEAIKKTLWNKQNTPILNGIDQYYGNNHDAVQHMVNHPKWGKYFEKPEDAIFPAFWKHWMAIVPHEQARGHTVSGYNELTDHRPFWEAIAPYLKKNEQSTPMQTAQQHAQWQLEYGEVPAMMLYYRHLLPRLLASAGQREAQATIRKAQELQVEILAKGAVTEAHSAANSVAGKPHKDPNIQSNYSANWRDIPDRPVQFQGRQVKTGRGVLTNNADSFHLLGSDSEHFYGLPDHLDPYKGWTEKDLVKIPKTQEDLDILSYPESVDTPGVVDADIHGVMGFVDHPETRALAHGFNFDLKSPLKAEGGRTVESGDSYWGKGPAGQHVFVKGASSLWYNQQEGPFNTARKEGIYHNLAKDFFGLGAHVPAVAVVRHPRTGQEHALIEHVKGDTVDSLPSSEYKAILNKVGVPTIQKLAAMNTVMGNIDRHDGNYMLSAEPEKGKSHLTLIDHNLYGQDRQGHPIQYLRRVPEAHESQMHPEVASWLKALDSGKFRDQLLKNGVPAEVAEGMMSRLEYLRDFGPTDAKFAHALHNAHAHYSGGVRQIPASSDSSEN